MRENTTSIDDELKQDEDILMVMKEKVLYQGKLYSIEKTNGNTVSENCYL
jgi:hypothetical protein